MAARDLRRPKARIEPRKRFYVYCEGKNTEPVYFAELQKIFRGALISIYTYGAAGVPYTCATSAVKKLEELGLGKNKSRRKGIESFERRDEVWAVFDRDLHPRVDDAIRLCQINGVGVGYSNPCFELWLILHFRDHDRPDSHHEIQKALENLDGSYNAAGRKVPNLKDIIANVERAEDRAEAQVKNRKEQGKPLGCPCTTVYLLTRAIRASSESAKITPAAL